MDLFECRNLLNIGKSIYEIPLRVTYYARVSTDLDAQLHSLSAQVTYYSEFIKKNSNWTFVEGYIDEGLSGTSVNKRESFMKMISDAKLGKFDFIITKEISRFSRSTLDSIKYTQELLSAGVGILFQNDNINTLHVDSELRLTIMSSIAQDEVRKLSERVRFGLKRSVESGIVLGNDVIWGYKKDKGKLTIDEKEAEIVRQIYHLYANERLGFRVLANRLAENGHYNTKGNKFGGSTLRRIISNPKYKGYFVGGKSQKYDYRQKQTNIDRDKWIIYKDEQTVPPIVSEELWEKANRILLKRREQIISEDKSSYQNKYPYSGKIMCMTHNAPYYHSIRKTDKPSGDYWRCKRNHNGEGCASPVVYTSELDEIMRVVMQNIFTNRESIISDLLSRYAEAGQKSELTVDIAKLKVRIAEIDKKKEGLIDLYVEGKLDGDGFKVHNDKLCDEAKGLESQITDYDNQVAKNRDFARQTQTLRSIITKELTFEESVSDGVISELLDRIEIRRGTSNPNKLNLRIYLKVADGYDDYNIFRNRGKSSAVALNKSAQTEGFSEKYVKCTRSDW